MKVKDVIEEYKKLDPEKNIWVEYDGVCIFPPIPDSRMTEKDAEWYRKDQTKETNEGDYVIVAG